MSIRSPLGGDIGLFYGSYRPLLAYLGAELPSLSIGGGRKGKVGADPEGDAALAGRERVAVSRLYVSIL